MARRTRRELPAGVKRLGERIEHWRRTREKRTRMPAELWSEAITLARREGRAYAIAKALRINFEGMKRRLAEAAGGSAPAPGAFVEVTGAEFLGAAAESGTVVELSEAAGIRMTVRFAAKAEVDVARLVAAFRQQRGA